MPMTRATSYQNRPIDDDVPPQSEDVPPMSAEKLYSYLGTLAELVERKARGTGKNGQGQSSSSFDDFKKLGPPQTRQRQRLGL